LFCFVLYCLYLWDPLNWYASNYVLGLFGKLLRRRGTLAWFHGIWTCDVEVLEYWMYVSNVHTFRVDCILFGFFTHHDKIFSPCFALPSNSLLKGNKWAKTLKDPNPQGSFIGYTLPPLNFLGVSDALQQHPHGYVQDLTVIDGLKPDLSARVPKP
jgi:hypothetical protein